MTSEISLLKQYTYSIKDKHDLSIYTYFNCTIMSFIAINTCTCKAAYNIGTGAPIITHWIC